MKLTEEQYLLIKLAEECNEVAQRITKALCFGIDEAQPVDTGGDGKTTNRERISRELDDLFGVIQMLKCRGKLRPYNTEAVDRKMEKVRKFMEYSRAQGILECWP